MCGLWDVSLLKFVEKPKICVRLSIVVFFYISKYIGYWVLMEEVFFLIWVVLFNKLIVLLKY